MTYALHETLEVHEIAAFKTVCLTKLKTMQLLVSDPALKQIMKQDVEATTRQLHELRAILEHANPEGMQG